MFRNIPPKTRSFHTVDAVAELLGYSTRTIRRWINAGDLKAHRIRNQLRISEADLQDFLNRSRA